jgi:hypothetical protein
MGFKTKAHTMEVKVSQKVWDIKHNETTFLTSSRFETFLKVPSVLAELNLMKTVFKKFHRFLWNYKVSSHAKT